MEFRSNGPPPKNRLCQRRRHKLATGTFTFNFKHLRDEIKRKLKFADRHLEY